MQKPIGILGGTFDPIHNGHLAMAKAALDECGLFKVVFMPNGNPPHKDGGLIVSGSHRYNMVSLAVGDIDGFEVSDYEIQRSSPSYTVDTNRVMKSRYNCPVYFIIGADSLYTLHLWRSFDVLIRECSFIVADRISRFGDDLQKECDRINAMGGNVIPLAMPTVEITSTDIRRDIAEGKDVSDALPDKVLKYIISNRLYTR